MKLPKFSNITFRVVILGLYLSLPSGCTKDLVCYDCKKKIPATHIEDLLNPRYEYETVCTVEEAVELERKNWNCEGFENPKDSICYSCSLLSLSTFHTTIVIVCGDRQYDIKTGNGCTCTEVKSK